VRRLLAFLGGLALIRALLRRRRAAPGPDTRAEELRRKLDDARGLEADREEFDAAETRVDEADADARRRDVHERARATIDEMRSPEE
jgi:hypothetical protein